MSGPVTTTTLDWHSVPWLTALYWRRYADYTLAARLSESRIWHVVPVRLGVAETEQQD